MNSLFGEKTRKDNQETLACKSEHWMISDYDEKIRDYSKQGYGYYLVKKVDDAGLGDKIEKIYTKLLHLGAFVLSNSKRIKNNFIHTINGFHTNDVYYTDTDSLYIENKHWDKLDKAGLVVKILIQGKNDLKDGHFFYALFLAPKTK